MSDLETCSMCQLIKQLYPDATFTMPSDSLERKIIVQHLKDHRISLGVITK